MPVFIPEPLLQTQLFAALLAIVLLIGIRRTPATPFFSKNTTLTLKGFAILAIIFAHVGYALASDDQFLFPLSVLAGVGVDLFLFLSGLGLTVSALARASSVITFYRRRLVRLYIPLWISLCVFFLLDYILLARVYDSTYLLHSFLGWFPTDDLWSDINSPLWYISLMLFYYLLFPLLFLRQHPFLSAIGVYATTSALVWWNPAPLEQLLPLYGLHLLAFPLGMLAGSLLVYRPRFPELPLLARNILLALSLGLAAYFAIFSGVGKDPNIEQIISITTMLLVVLFFALIRLDIHLLRLFGVYSFEIYLIHWPIMSRFDVFFRLFPAWFALALYLALFVSLGYLFHRATEALVRTLAPFLYGLPSPQQID